MKRVKLSFVIVALFAIASAFALRPTQGNLYGKTGANSFVKLDPAKQGQSGSGGWRCQSSSDTCRFNPGASINPADPIGTTYTRSQMGSPVGTTLDHVLILNP
ncbi:MAG: hypothetical protein J0I84_07450 [Terrimonas sp.]|nr:hypothetical protein [Terrimonas sp.]